MSRLNKLKEFLASEPDDSFTRYALGLEYAKVQNLPEAIATLEYLRERDPKYVPTYYMLGGYYREIGQKEMAQTIYQAGIHVAHASGDHHASSELQSALAELEDELEN